MTEQICRPAKLSNVNPCEMSYVLKPVMKKCCICDCSEDITLSELARFNFSRWVG